MIEAVRIKGFIRGGIVKVTWYDRRATDAEFTPDVVGGNVLTIFVDDSSMKLVLVRDSTGFPTALLRVSIGQRPPDAARVVVLWPLEFRSNARCLRHACY